jgi:hypothetical protein
MPELKRWKFGVGVVAEAARHSAQARQTPAGM